MKYLLLALLAACGDNGVGGPAIRMNATSEAPAYGDTPFPTDAVRDGAKLGRVAGLEHVAQHQTEQVIAHLAELDGFGLRPLVEFFVDGEFDGELAGHVVDPDGVELAYEWRYIAERHVIAGSPASGTILREGTTYTAYVTSDALEPASVPTTGRWRATSLALAKFPDAAGITVFTTQHASRDLLAARDAMLAMPAPPIRFDDPEIVFTGTTAIDQILGVATRADSGERMGLERWGNDNPTGIAHEHVGVIATGTIDIARFRGDDTGTNLPGDETFQIVDGAPVLVAIEPIPITVILPAAPPPATGYPVIIHGHGLGASRDQLLSFAEPYTARGFALVGIDMAGHGSRYDAIDRGANMAAQLHDFTGDPMRRDGFGDTTGAVTQLDFFENFLSVTAVRDSIRQSALDLVRVAASLRAHPDLLGVHLDTSHLAYTGESFGTVVGTVFAAIEPGIDFYVLDVPGGGILDLILPYSPEITTLAVPLIDGLYGPYAALDRWSPLIALMQAVIDGADPLTYAPHVLRDRFADTGPRSVFAIEVVGDQVLSNRGTDALAAELGLATLGETIASPASRNVDGQTAVLVKYGHATHGANWSAERGTYRFVPGTMDLLPQPVTIDEPIYETLSQVGAALEAHARGEVPAIEDVASTERR